MRPKPAPCPVGQDSPKSAYSTMQTAFLANQRGHHHTNRLDGIRPQRQQELTEREARRHRRPAARGYLLGSRRVPEGLRLD